MKRWRGLVKIVLDTNIIVSGLISNTGAPALLLRAWLDGKFTLITSKGQLKELCHVLEYDRLRSRISPEQRKNLLKNIDVEAIVCDILPDIDISPDPDDNITLATAIAGKANLIITGDKRHMLALEKVESIPIITARDALEQINL